MENIYLCAFILHLVIERSGSILYMVAYISMSFDAKLAFVPTALLSFGGGNI